MATWNPKTWSVDELLTSSDFNTEIRDNLNTLKNPPVDDYVVNEGSDYTSNYTTWQNVDATNLALTIDTSGGAVLVHFHGAVSLGASCDRVYFDLEVDGVREGGDDGITMLGVANSKQNVSFTRRIAGLSAASHTFKLKWKVNAGTVTMYAGAGTANFDLHPQMWVAEIT